MKKDTPHNSPLSKEDIEQQGWTVTTYERKAPPYQVEWLCADKGKGYDGYRLCINLAHPDSILTVWKHTSKIYVGRCRDLADYFIIKELIGLP